MATGPGFGGLLPLAMLGAGLFTLLRARARRRSGKDLPDPEQVERQAAAAEMERRMASYLAQRDTGGHDAALADRNGQENGR